MVKKTWVSVKSQGEPENQGTEGNRWSLLSGQAVDSFTLIKMSIFSLSLFFIFYFLNFFSLFSLSLFLNRFNHLYFFLFLKFSLEYS